MFKPRHVGNNYTMRTLRNTVTSDKFVFLDSAYKNEDIDLDRLFVSNGSMYVSYIELALDL